MVREFPKLNTTGNFPGVSNIDVYQYDNDFDYSRYDNAQMSLILCTVPWDMGEVHVGQRTITGIGNVVYFGSKANRDNYFANIPDADCYRWTTKYKELHRDKTIDVPVPFDVAARYNYIAVHYDLFANDDSLVQYEKSGGLVDWFWFVREVEFIAPNTTRLHLLNDAWQTFIYDFQIDEMILERGHAPMYETDADTYLSNPIGNCANLLSEDVSYGDAHIVADTSSFVFNSGNMFAVIVSTANPYSGTWGTKAAGTWKVPAKRNFTVQGNPTYCAFAVPVSNLSSFLTDVESAAPQFLQTVKGIYLVASKLITTGNEFDFCEHTCRLVSAEYQENQLVQLDKSLFGYATEYADIAKLYTWPYAYMTVTDENGDGIDVRIEDTNGTLQLESCVSLAYPWLNISGHILGIGKAGRRNVSFTNLTGHTLPIGGNWAQTLMKWEIPAYGISQDAGDNYDFATDFDRKQATLAANNAYTSSVANADTGQTNANASADAGQASANASAQTAYTNANQSAWASRENAYDNADTGKSNADDSADTAKDNADRSAGASKSNAYETASALVANAGLQKDANNAIKTASDTSINDNLNNTVTYNTGLTTANNILVDAAATSTIQAADEQAAISAISGGITAAASAGASVASGDVAGAVTSAINGIVGSAATLASNSVAVSLTSANAGFTMAGNSANARASNTKSTNDATVQKDFLTAQRDAQNDLTTGTAANSATATQHNADREYTAATQNALDSQTTTKGNATRDRTTARQNALRSYQLARGGDDAGHDFGDGVNKRNYDTAIANAARTRDTSVANAARTRDTSVANAARTRDTALSAIANDVSQAALREPFEFGEFANGENSATRPMGVFANVVTQNDYAISRAGDEMLRYGYMFGKRWHFDGNWNICSHFTYWKLTDFWIKDLNIPDMYCDQLRFFLFGGVTVWRNPADIGRVSIYDNGL